MNNSSQNVTISEDIRKRLTTIPKWVEPCGPTYGPQLDHLDADVLDGTVEMPRDDQLISSVAITAETALAHATMFLDRYLGETFKTPHSNMQYDRYPWLPGRKEIPKELGESLDKEYLDKLDLDTTLVNSYEYMQKYAMCLEQTVWDQELLNLDFHKEFMECEFKCRTLLCELQGAIMERGLTPRPNVDRDVMPISIRGEWTRHNASYRNMRDWLCYRDYMNGLEFVYQAFSHLRCRYPQNCETQL